MIKPALLAAGLILAVSGCTTSGRLYDWGNYENNLFNYYHNPATKAAVIANHLEYLEALERNQKRPPPGLLAEAGTLLLIEGDTQRAITYYQQEHDLWPESRAMMSVLIKNLSGDKNK